MLGFALLTGLPLPIRPKVDGVMSPQGSQRPSRCCAAGLWKERPFFAVHFRKVLQDGNQGSAGKGKRSCAVSSRSQIQPYLNGANFSLSDRPPFSRTPKARLTYLPRRQPPFLAETEPSSSPLNNFSHPSLLFINYNIPLRAPAPPLLRTFSSIFYPYRLNH